MAGVGGFTDIGRDVVADAVIGDSAYPRYNNTNARLGVGNGNDAFDPAHTNLQGGSNVRLPMQATYPQRSANALAFASVADGDTGNFAWQEWALFNHASAGQMLVRFVQSMGTKGAGTTWNATATVTIVHPS